MTRLTPQYVMEHVSMTSIMTNKMISMAKSMTASITDVTKSMTANDIYYDKENDM